MATRNLAYRIAVEGKEAAISAQREIADSAAVQWPRAAAEAERAAKRAEVAVETARRKAAAAATYQPSATAQAINASVGYGSLKNLSQSGAYDVGPSKSARASAAAFSEALANEERAVRALKAAIDPLWAAQQRLVAETATADQLLKRNAITTREHAAAVGLAQKQYGQAEVAVKRLGQANSFAAYELTNLGYQFNDAFVGFASGQKPLTIFIQQGAQVAQILGNREGGIAAGFSALTRLFPIGAVAFGGAAVALGLVAKAGLDFDESQRQLAISAAGLGRAAGYSRSELEATAQSGARAGKVSVSAAREMTAAFAGTGKIGGAVFGDLIALQRDYAVATGRDSKAATEALAQAMADPVKGAADLNQELGFLNATTLEQITRMTQLGDRTGAQKLLTNELKSSVAGLADTYGGFRDGLQKVANVFGLVNEKVGEFQRLASLPLGGGFANYVKNATDEAEARSNLAQVNKASGAARDLRLSLFGDPVGELRAKEATLSRGYAAQLAGGELGEAVKTRDALDAVTRARQSYLAPAEKAHQLAVIDAKLASTEDAKSKARLAGEREKINLAGVVVTSAEAEVRVRDASTLATSRASRAGVGHAESLARQAAAQELSARSALDVANAYLTGDVAGQRAEARRKALTDATRKGIDVEAEARRQAALVVADRAQEGGKAVAELVARSKAQRQVNDAVAAGAISGQEAQRQLQLEGVLRPFVVAEAIAEGRAKTTLAAVIRDLKAAQADENAEAARGGLLAGAQAADDRIAALRLEAQYAGDLTGQRERMAASLRLEQSPDYRGATDEGARSVALFNAMAEVEQELATRRAQTAAATLSSQQSQIEVARTELELVGKSAAEQSAVLARLQRIQELKREGIDLSSAEATAILDQGAALDAITQRLAATNENWREMQSIGERVIDQVLNPQNWRDWGDLGRSILSDLSADLLRLAAINPLKNALFGSSLPTANGVGGLFGKLFGGAAKGLMGTGGIYGDFDVAGGGFKFKLPPVLNIPGFAKGTDFAPGGLAMVGERGPELVNLPRGAQVFSNAESRRMGGGATFHVSVNAEAGVSKEEVEAMVHRGMAAAVRTANNNVPGIVSDAAARGLL